MMYKAIKRGFGSRTVAAIVAVLCAVYMLCCVAVGYAASTTKVHVAGTLEVEAVDAVFTKMQMVDESKSSISAEGNTIKINVSGLGCPGAYAVAQITAKNMGTLDATLVDISTVGSTVDYIKIDMADVPVGEVLSPGEECVFEIVTCWDPARDDITKAKDSTDFKIVMTYENDEYVDLPTDDDSNDDINVPGSSGNGGNSSGDNGGSDVPETGDNANYTLIFGIAIACAVIMVICLIFIIFGKKRKEDEDDKR